MTNMEGDAVKKCATEEEEEKEVQFSILYQLVCLLIENLGGCLEDFVVPALELVISQTEEPNVNLEAFFSEISFHDYPIEGEFHEEELPEKIVFEGKNSKLKRYSKFLFR